jgi:hypothetical protein
MIPSQRGLVLVSNCAGTGVGSSIEFYLDTSRAQSVESMHAQAFPSGSVAAAKFQVEVQIDGADAFAAQEDEWDAIADPTFSFVIAPAATYRLTCTEFSGSGTMSVVGVGAPFSPPADISVSGGGGSSDNASVGTIGDDLPDSATVIGSKDAGGKTQAASEDNPLPVAIVSGGGGGGDSAATGALGDDAPTSGIVIAVIDPDGKLRAVSSTYPLRTDPANVTTPLLPSNAAQETGGALATLAGAVSANKVQTNPPSHASTNVDQLNGATVSTNSGTKDGGTQRVVLATDQPQNTNALKVDGSAVTQPISVAPATSGGLGLPFSALVSNTATAVKTSAGQVYGWSIGSAANSAPAYVQVFNKATGSVTLGSTTPDWVIEVPAGAGSNMPVGPIALAAHGTAITIAVTSTRTGSTAVGSGAHVNFFVQ